MPFGFSFGKSKSQQTSSGEAASFIDPAQVAFLRNLRQQGQQLQGQQQGQIGQLFGLGQNLQGQGQNFLSGLQQQQQQLGQAPGQLPGQGALQGIAGGQGASQAQQALQQQAFGQNPILGQQIGQLGEDINQQLQRQIGGAGGIASGAIGAGQGPLGGRAQVAQGIQGEAALNAFQRGATQLRGQDIGRQLGAAQALGGLEQQGVQQQLQAGGLLGQLGLGQQGLQQQGQLGAGQLGLGGLGALQGQFNLGLSPFQAQFGPLQNLAGLIGAPTVLSESAQRAQGSGSALNFGFSNLVA